MNNPFTRPCTPEELADIYKKIARDAKKQKTRVIATPVIKPVLHENIAASIEASLPFSKKISQAASTAALAAEAIKPVAEETSATGSQTIMNFTYRYLPYIMLGAAVIIGGVYLYQRYEKKKKKPKKDNT